MSKPLLASALNPHAFVAAGSAPIAGRRSSLARLPSPCSRPGLRHVPLWFAIPSAIFGASAGFSCLARSGLQLQLSVPTLPSRTAPPNNHWSGPPPARHLARDALTVIIRLAGQLPSRLRPLSSNVRPCIPPSLHARHASSTSTACAQCRPGLSAWERRLGLGTVAPVLMWRLSSRLRLSYCTCTRVALIWHRSWNCLCIAFALTCSRTQRHGPRAQATRGATSGTSVVFRSFWNLSVHWPELPSAGCRERSWSI
jgi:hypothetical protein